MLKQLDIDNDIDKSLMNALYGVELNRSILAKALTSNAYKTIILMSKVIESCIYAHFTSIDNRENKITDDTWNCIVETLNDLKIISEQLKAKMKESDN